ncbi:amyloid beta A4 precursor protein-binding family B member 1-interacting protein isoform X3 [Ctenocephalides felis]|nr:amyloid beta A4 precursor protein-binding family B member 1-interacting protein isoform X3 [Ctenocephalides felis]
MANLEESHEAELDAILGELSALEQKNDTRQRRTHSRNNSDCTRIRASTEGDGTVREPRNDSPDNDSAFSDTVSLLSSESSASSGASSGLTHKVPLPIPCPEQILNTQQQHDGAKAAKIHLALQKLARASVRRLFVKAFSADGASKSLLVDERMSCGHVTRLLADKNHVKMEPHWSLVEHLPDLQMERLYEDHELLVDNLMLWSRDSKNRVLFLQRLDKTLLFTKPEEFLSQSPASVDHDEHSRSLLLEEFFNGTAVVAMEGPLYLKSDSKKGWKKYHFVLRASGLYYYPKDKGPRSPRDLQCLASFTGHELYRGVSWKKKHRAPSDFCFALKPPRAPSVKGGRGLKMLCVEDEKLFEKWLIAIRIAKHGRRLLDNHRTLLEDLAREEIDALVSARSGSNCSISIPPMPITNSPSSGRLSRASSSSSSGCMSDENGFESEFPMGTIKRKPSMKPNLPLTSMTRQLKEVGDTTTMGGVEIAPPSSPHSPQGSQGGTLTRRHSRRRSDDCSSNGTLKRITRSRGSIESMGSIRSGHSTPTPSTPDTSRTNMLPEVSPNNAVSLSCMTDSMCSLLPPPPPLELSSEDLMSASTLSLDSLPPPPPPLDANDSADYIGTSMLSLTSLPPPPPNVQSNDQIDNRITSPISSDCSTPSKILSNTNITSYDSPKHNIKQLEDALQAMTDIANSAQNSLTQTNSMDNVTQSINNMQLNHNVVNNNERNIIYTQSLHKKPPGYKLPPPYNQQIYNTAPSPKTVTFADSMQMNNNKLEKCVKFAESPVLLRRKVCFEDQKKVTFDEQLSPSKRMNSYSRTSSYDSNQAPLPPPRAEATRLSANCSSPKRLADSASNPPRDFLKDLQRVMRRKWQVAQKCKLEPATTPHEVLGFRDPPPPNPHYRETNVSNWVQEHYGDNLYENLGGPCGSLAMNQQMNGRNGISQPPMPHAMQPTMAVIPTQSSIVGVMNGRNKRPPPPPPKRSESTQLTTGNRNSTTS